MAPLSSLYYILSEPRTKGKQMALIKCPECGKEISTNAEECPNCGLPIKELEENTKKHTTKALNQSIPKVPFFDAIPWWINPIIIGLSLIGVVIMIIVLNNNNSELQIQKPQPQVSSNSLRANSNQENTVSSWRYETGTNEQGYSYRQALIVDKEEKGILYMQYVPDDNRCAGLNDKVLIVSVPENTVRISFQFDGNNIIPLEPSKKGESPVMNTGVSVVISDECLGFGKIMEEIHSSNICTVTAVQNDGTSTTYTYNVKGLDWLYF